MSAAQYTTGNVYQVVSKQVADLLQILSWTPYMTLEEMAACVGKGSTATRKHVTKAEKMGLVSHVLHGLLGRKGSRRHFLTGKGVQTLAELEGLRVAELMDAPGATGMALAIHHRRIDILEGVYQTAATVARCLDEPDLDVHVPRHGPLDGLVRIPEDNRSFGVIVKRPVINDKYFGLKAWRYGAQVENKPSALLVVAPSYLAEHGAQRLVEENWSGEFWITSLEDIGDPDDYVWHKPGYGDDEKEGWTMREVLQNIPEDRLDEDDLLNEPYKRAALPRRGWSPRRVLTPAERRTLYAIADWPLAKGRVTAVIGKVTPATVHVMLRRLCAHGLIGQVETKYGELRWALTDAGLRYICASARAADDDVRKFWSSKKRDDGRLAGRKLRKLNHEIRHTEMVHELVAKVAEEAAAVDVQILPAHLTEMYPVKPDARIDLGVWWKEEYRRCVLLLEAERGMLSRAKMRKRLSNYAKVFESAEFQASFPAQPYIAIVLEDPVVESNFNRSQVEAGWTHLPIIMTNMEELMAPGGGLLEAVWRRPGKYFERLRFVDLSE